MTITGDAVVFTNVSSTFPVPVAAKLLIPATADRLQVNEVPGVVLVAKKVNGLPLLALVDRGMFNAGIGFGAATPMPSGLVQLLTVCLTV